MIKNFGQVAHKGLIGKEIAYSDIPRMTEVFAKRHQFFTIEKGWVEEIHTMPGLETDKYDSYAIHLGVYYNLTLVGYMRLLPWNPKIGFMLDESFSPLLPENVRQELPRERSAEISRLLIISGGKDEILSAVRRFRVLETLYKLFYRTAKQRELEYFYMESEPAWLKGFNQMFAFGFEAICEPYTFPDMTQVVIAESNIHRMERTLREADPEQFAWYIS